MDERKLYVNRVATTSRAVLAFCEVEGVAADIHDVDLMAGEHHSDEFTAMNPSRLVPVLVDGDFVLTEASAILRYLAQVTGSSWLPTEPRARARVDEAMAWFEANLYKDLGFNLVYPQILPHHQRASEAATEDTVSWGGRKTRAWLEALETSVMMHGDYLAGSTPTVADLLGLSILSLGDLINLELGGFPRVQAWTARVTALPAWKAVNGAFDDFAASVRGSRQFAGLV